MFSAPGIRLGTIIDNFKFEVLFGPEGYREREITTEDVNRPGMQLTGFFDYFDEKRIQMIGLVETSYLERLTSEERRHRFDMLLSYHVPAIILARNLEPFPELTEMAKKHNRVLLRTKENTANIMSTLIAYLRMALSPTITRHGVLVEVYGEGVLLMGESGVGKSETAIELVKRGHRLIADDAVEIRRGLNNRLFGTAPELIRHYIELRGIGVVDVRRLFGMSAIKFDSTVDLLINLEVWKDGAIYDRLGADEFFTPILDVEIPTLTIPVKPGRNLAVIIEVAAMNNRNKKMGHNAALEFAHQVDQHIQRETAAREQDQV
ncbi:MAG TPA: HPr(Ser) kinase/phosphatase [Candidatus Enterenecus stercoripullorum]|nr:HPr(Ser) kinase/phosphatase [Candidatus Enterenecus stercoripullorum]